MAAKDKAPESDPLIVNRSDLEKMSDAEKQAFRAKGGTVTEDPQPNKDSQ